MPPPMHIVTTTRFAPRRRPSISAWSGEPRAGDTVGMPDGDRATVHVQPIVRNAQRVARVDHCTAKASFISHRSMSSIAQSRPGEQLAHREHGTDAHLVGLAAGDGERAEHAIGARPRFAAADSLMTTQAAAPSENWLALPRRSSAGQRGLDLRHALVRRVGADALVGGDRHVLA
jgi:hypothetical protein